MPRIPYPDPKTLSEAKRDVLANPPYGRLLNISRMAMHAPDAYWSTQRALGQATVHTKTLEPRLKEYIILRIAYLSNSDYELHHHKSLAANLGVSEDQFAALQSGDFSGFSPLERAVLTFVTEVVLNVSPSDATLAEVRSHVPDERVFEIVYLTGSYMMTARAAAVAGIEADEEAVRSWT